MKHTLLLTLTALVLTSLTPARAASLVTNGSFEQGLGGIGSFTGWTTTLGDSATFVDSSGQTGTHAGQASNGLWAAYFGSTTASGGSSISQTLATGPNQTYVLSFDLANDNGGGPALNTFRVSIAGTTAFNFTNLPAQDYAHLQFFFTGTSAASTLTFAASNDFGYLQLDNVSVEAVPEPSSLALLLCSTLAAASTLVYRRSPTSALKRSYPADPNPAISG